MLDIHDEFFLDAKCNSSGNAEKNFFNVILGVPCDYGTARVASIATSWNWPLIYPAARYM